MKNTFIWLISHFPQSNPIGADLEGVRDGDPLVIGVNRANDSSDSSEGLSEEE